MTDTMIVAAVVLVVTDQAAVMTMAAVTVIAITAAGVMTVEEDTAAADVTGMIVHPSIATLPEETAMALVGTLAVTMTAAHLAQLPQLLVTLHLTLSRPGTIPVAEATMIAPLPAATIGTLGVD